MKNIISSKKVGPSQISKGSDWSGGFTLIEMLVVIAIIAILTGIVMTSLVGSKGKARDAKRISDLGQIQLALSLYYDRCKQYPNSLVSLTAATNGTCPTNGINMSSFMSVLPTPPASSQYHYAFKYDNASPSNVVDYVLHAALENNNEAVKDSLPMPDAESSTSIYNWVSSVVGINSSSNGKSITGFTCDKTINYCLGPK